MKNIFSSKFKTIIKAVYTDPFSHHLIYTSNFFLESSLDNETQTPSDETEDASWNKEEAGQTTTHRWFTKERKKKKIRSSFQDEIITLQLVQVAPQDQQV